MRFEFSDVIAHPKELVYAVYRDRLVDLVDYLDDVESIKVLKRDEGVPGRVKLLNEWTSGGQVPAFLMPIAKKYKVYQITWLDHAEWVDAESAVYWTMEFQILKEYVSCKGRNVMEAAGDKTKITITGDMNLDFSKVRLMPKIILNKLTEQTEKFVLKRVEPNLRNINRGLERFLDEHGAEIAKGSKKKAEAGDKN